VQVVMVVKSDVVHDARVRREACSLRDAGHRVTIVGDRPPAVGAELDGIDLRWAGPAAPAAEPEVTRLPAVLRMGRWAGLPTHRRRAIARFEAGVLAAAEDLRADVVHAHDLSGLGVGHLLATRWGSRLLYDAHECWTGRRLEGRPEPLGRLRDRRLERSLGGDADAVVTVSEGIASWLSETYGWDAVAVVRNTFEAAPAPPPDRPPTGVLYAGRIDRKRDLVTAVRGLAGHPLTLSIVGPADEQYRAELGAAGVRTLPSLDIDEVDEAYRAAGIALVPLTDDQLNHRLALPNKLFHAVRAGIPVIAADLPELRRLVTRHELGALYRPGDPASLREAANTVVSRYDQLLETVARAQESLTWTHDEAVLLDVYARLEGRLR
jgi:glycogen synthase